MFSVGATVLSRHRHLQHHVVSYAVFPSCLHWAQEMRSEDRNVQPVLLRLLLCLFVYIKHSMATVLNAFML